MMDHSRVGELVDESLYIREVSKVVLGSRIATPHAGKGTTESIAAQQTETRTYRAVGTVTFDKSYAGGVFCPSGSTNERTFSHNKHNTPQPSTHSV